MTVSAIQALNSAAQIARTAKTAKVRERAVDSDGKRKKPSTPQGETLPRDKKAAPKPIEAVCTNAVQAALFNLQLRS
jgi:hypothetical protein